MRINAAFRNQPERCIYAAAGGPLEEICLAPGSNRERESNAGDKSGFEDSLRFFGPLLYWPYSMVNSPNPIKLIEPLSAAIALHFEQKV